MTQMLDDTVAELRRTVADLHRKLDARTAERDEAFAQQTATAEVLQVINSSRGDLAPVFDVMLEKAMRLCEAAFGVLWTYDGERLNAVAMRGVPGAFADFARQPLRPGPETGLGRLLRGEHLIHITDISADKIYRSGDRLRVATVELGGARTLLLVPLRKDDTLLGIFSVYRQEVRPFSDKQIALLQNFAAQAVIAMENARLLTETREALEQQTATAEVLQVINSSPGDLAPVFDAMLEKATRLSDAAFGLMQVYDGERFRTVATRRMPPALAEFLLQTPRQPTPHSAVSRILDGEDFVHFEDMTSEQAYLSGDPRQQAFVKLGGTRTYVAVALRKDDRLLGTIGTYRQEVRPFSDKQIALLQNFAAQAVIAMENARLITETREALEQQTATTEVLQVINSSPGDLAPVFGAMLEKALRLGEAAFGIMNTYDGERFRPVALRGVPPALAELYLSSPPDTGPNSVHTQIAWGEDLVRIEDMTTYPGYLLGEARPRAVVELGGARSYVAVALRKDRRLVGTIAIYRQQVLPFTDKHVALLQNFAAQAVIAIENARLINETREALEQQTATAEVLRVINSSPGVLAPVFDAVLEKAHSLCDVAYGSLELYEGENFRSVAERGLPRAFADMLRQGYQASDNPATRPLIEGSRVTHIADLAETDYAITQSAVELVSIRTLLCVPLRRNNVLLGMIACARQEVRPFTEKEIALLENLAAQAVIAMENARLITETREALEQQTATTEVLQVINSSPGDLVPVFDIILNKAHNLCGASRGTLFLFDGETFRAAAAHGYPEDLAERLRQGISGPIFAPLIEGARLIHYPDLTQIDDPLARSVSERGGVRTNLLLPLRKDAVLLGMISCNRHEVRPFAEKEIALLENFAAQAVIAMENARLITETREALEQQTATAEILQVINSSPGDLTPVFAAMLDKAMRLCEANFGFLSTYDGEHFNAVALHGLPNTYVREYLTGPYLPGPNTTHDRLVHGELVVHVYDLAVDEADSPRRRAVVEILGVRSILAVPLRKDGKLLGAIHVYRREIRPFTDKQIALLQNFAAQAVIATENARLLDEIRQRQQELRVTFDNMVDGVAMFDEALHLAAWNRNFQQLLQLPDEFLAQRHDFDTYIRYLTERGEFGETDPETQIKRLRARIGDHYSFERTRPDGTVIEVRHNPMPGGGIVLIYSDITERKRSEAEIRAARDAAEAAYRDLKAAQASLIQAEKMASLGQLTAGIAHEIKNPLNFVNNFADLSVELLDELKETAAPAIAALGVDKRAEVDETIVMLTGNLEKIAEHGRRADGIVKSMLEHSRGGTGERRSVDLNGLIEDALNLAYHGARAQDQSFNITLERDCEQGITPIELVPQDITRVCLNLIGNGFYAATKRRKEGSDPEFQPTLKVTTRDLGDAVEIAVRDNGTGIAPEIKDKLFQPFFTTKPTGEGTGLGLSISYDIVTQQHGGTIAVDSKVGKFTEFTIRLPRSFQATRGDATSHRRSGDHAPI